MQKGFIAAGLELVGTYKKTVCLSLEHIFDLIARKAVQIGFGYHIYLFGRCIRVFRIAGKGDDGFIGAFSFCEAFRNGIEVFNGFFNAAGYDHCPGLIIYAESDAFVEMFHHNFSFLHYGFGIKLHIFTETLLRLTLVEQRIFLNGFYQMIITLTGGIVLENVKNKTFFYGLFHRIMKDFFPEVIGGDFFWIGRVARPIVIALIERQKPGIAAFQPGTKPHFFIVYAKWAAQRLN
jgi:hypothetical protein